MEGGITHEERLRTVIYLVRNVLTKEFEFINYKPRIRSIFLYNLKEIIKNITREWCIRRQITDEALIEDGLRAAQEAVKVFATMRWRRNTHGRALVPVVAVEEPT